MHASCTMSICNNLSFLATEQHACAGREFEREREREEHVEQVFHRPTLKEGQMAAKALVKPGFGTKIYGGLHVGLCAMSRASI